MPRPASGGRAARGQNTRQAAKPASSRLSESRSPRHALRWLRNGIIAAIWGTLALAAVLLWFARDLPRPEDALAPSRRPGLTLTDMQGRVVARFGDVVGDAVHLADLPPYVPAAVVAIEDRRFWAEPGIDPIGLARAALTDLLRWRVAQGGSTLTQQVAKNLFLTNARTFRRKVQELLLTFWLTAHFSKQQILEIWLNRIYFGAGAWGIDAASRLYFGVPARRLSLPQAAVLAGLPRAPSRFNPRANPQAAAARAREVLAAMVATGALSNTQATVAAERIAFPGAQGGAGWFADWAAGQGEEVLPPGEDAVLRTTLDAKLQAIAEARLGGAACRAGCSAQRFGRRRCRAGRGERRRAGDGRGRDPRQGGFNRAVAARRQPGSAFKPFVWLAALEHGVRLEDSVLDAPIRLGTWSPQNFDRRFRGTITVEEALAQSVNTVAVRLLLKAGGPRAVASVAHRLGIADPLPDNASLALGTGGVGLLELTGAYAAFCNGGRAVAPFGVATISAAGTAETAPHRPPREAVAPTLAADMAKMLQAAVARGTGHDAALPGRFVAGKTGTTEDYRDAWFIGCVDNTVIGVWLGNDDNAPMRAVSGGTLPAALFRDIAQAVR